MFENLPQRLRQWCDALLLRFVGAARQQDYHQQRICELGEHNEQMRWQVRNALAELCKIREENERLLAHIDRVTAELAKARTALIQNQECKGK